MPPRSGSCRAAERSRTTLICISGNLGAAYMGLRLLEREKRVLADVENPEPKFGGYEYLLENTSNPVCAGTLWMRWRRRASFRRR